MRFSRTRLTVACSPGGIRQGPPRPVGPWREDGSGEGDQPGALGGAQFPASPSGWPLVALGHEDGEPLKRVAGDLIELAGYFRYGNSARQFNNINLYALNRLARFVAKRHKRSWRYGWKAVACQSPDRLGLINLNRTVAAPRPNRPWRPGR
jgi:hypothetical protein